MGDVDGHSIGPEEKCNESVLSNVAKEYAEPSIKKILIVLQVQTVMDSKKKVANKDIAEEAKCDLAKEITPKILKDPIDDDCNQYKETRNEDSCGVEYASEVFTFLSFYFNAHGIQSSDFSL